MPAKDWRYPHHLALEALIAGGDDLVDAGKIAGQLVTARQPGISPFNSLPFELYRATGESRWLEVFVEKTLQPMHPDFPRSAEGAWLHPCGKHRPGCHAMLLDSFQEEASRLIKITWLVRRGMLEETAYLLEKIEREVLHQFQLYRRILREPGNGLWHNGRDWVGDGLLSPGFWSRGHGWLLRGLNESLAYTENPELHEGLLSILQETADALFAVRRPDKLWNALLDSSEANGLVETSGSAMITAMLIRAIHRGWLPDASLPELQRTAAILVSDYLNTSGQVLDACEGPGPLMSEEDYRPPATFPLDEPHGIAAFCLLFSSETT